MWASIAAAIIAACASITSALIAAHSANKARESDAARARYEAERRQQESEREHIEEATAQGMLAVLEAVDVSLIALQGGHLDGNVDAARARIADARDAYQTTRSKAIAKLL